MSLTVSSWNMQGAGSKKITSIQSSEHDISNTDIFLLQETGNPGNRGFEVGKPYTCMRKSYRCGVARVDPTAVTFRCTNAVLIRDDLFKLASFGSVEILGYRDIAYVLYRDIVFASIHAHAVDNPSMVVDVVDAFNKRWANNDWVLMGDFNTDPTNIAKSYKTKAGTVNEICLRGTVDRPQSPCLLIYPRDATQGPKGDRVRRLDYAFLSDSLSRYRVCGIANSRIYGSRVPQPATLLSDHNMVTIQLGI